VNDPKNTKDPDLRVYLRANLIVWGLVLATAVAAFFICGAVWDDVTSGTEEFIIFVLGGGFTLVSVLDFIYQKYSSSFSGGEKKS
jgi:hypothetical protein